ncbi:hypothetical protein ABW20_dc0105760 [Dactylellina cionopaga]|nr:hypothetical protein ABW20_dc0105760 [Dactylellina cionopaga]
MFSKMFKKESATNPSEWRPQLPRLSIESGSLHLDLEAGSATTTVTTTSEPGSTPPVPPSTAVSAAYTFSSSTLAPTSPPPAYLNSAISLEKQIQQGEYIIPPHAQLVDDVESVYEVHELSLYDRFQASHNLRMLFILLLSFIIIGGIAAGVLVLLVKKS